MWWGIISSLIISTSTVLTQATLQAQPSGASGTEEPFDFESFFKELTQEIEKVEAEAAKKTPEGQPATLSKEIPQPPALSPLPYESITAQEPTATPLLSAPEEQGKRDPISLFTQPALKTIETERQKITEPSEESIAAFHTILDDNLTERMEPTRVGLITYLSELETKIVGSVSPVSEHFKNDYRTLYQKTLHHIILLINQIGSNRAYIKLFLVPPQETAQNLASLRAKIIDCLQASKDVLSKITITGEEEEPIGLLKKLAQRPSSHHHHHPEHTEAYQHNVALSPLEKSIINVLERLKPIEMGLASFVASKDYQEAIKKLIDAEKAKEKEARARQERRALGGFAPWHNYLAPHMHTPTPGIAPHSMPLPWWNDPSWLNTGDSSSSYAPSMFPTTPTGTGMAAPSSGTSSTSKAPTGKVKASEEDKGGHGRALEEDTTQKAFNRTLNAINQATATTHQTLENIKGMAPDDAARNLLSTGAISKITHQLEQIEKMKLDLPEEQPSVQGPEAMGRGISIMGKAAQAGRTKSDRGSADQQKKIKRAEQELDKNLATLAPCILRAHTLKAPEGREQEQKKIPQLYQYLNISQHIVDERAKELLHQEHTEWEQKTATVRSITLATAAELKKYFEEQKQALEKKAAQFPLMPQPFQERLIMIGKHLQQIKSFQEQHAAKAPAAGM